jgi:catechol 2,3-dioxygenase-like lactoylglutathione lyase family enzyme
VQVGQVDFVTIPTRDVPRAVAFYRDTLGLPESRSTDGFFKDPDGNVVILHRRYAPRG